MRATRGIGVGILLALAGSGVATAADPGPGKVQVRNELGVAVGADIAGVDGLELAVERIKTGPLARADATKPWSIVLGAGVYGDALINVPNIAVAPEPGAGVVVTGIGGADNTAKGCIDVTRGGVTIEAITCRGQAGNGIQASIPFSEAGVTLRNITVEQVVANAIEITGGQGALIVNPTITAAGNDGISFIRANGPGPYRVEGGLVRQSKNDGIDLHDDTRNVQIVGTTLEANTADGIRSEDAGNADLVVDQVHLNRNGNGLSFGGGALRQAITNSDVSGSVGNGIVLGAGTGIQVRNIRFDGSNVGGDLRFSNDSRAGGVYDGLTFIDTPMSLPGEPKGVVVTSATAAQRTTLLPVPANFVGLNRIVRVRDIDSKASSAVTLRYSFAPGELAATRTGSVQVYEDDRPATRSSSDHSRQSG